jgi:hypothetical protein
MPGPCALSFCIQWSTWLKEKLTKSRWEPLPYQTGSNCDHGTQKKPKSLLPGVEQGNILSQSQPAAFPPLDVPTGMRAVDAFIVATSGFGAPIPIYLIINCRHQGRIRLQTTEDRRAASSSI